MKKIAILTWLHNDNFGSALQAFALQKFLKQSNFEVVDIDYNPTKKERLINWVKSHNSVKLFLEKIKESKNTKNDAYKERLDIQRKKINSFVKERINLTNETITSKQLKNIGDKYDIYICGSDQIWSPKLLNPSYYLDFVDESKRKISYATSFGSLYFTKYKKKIIKELLRTFDNISVRENEAKKEVEKLINKEVPVVVDPTFLLEHNEWNSIASCSKNIKENYIFCYLLGNNKEYINSIRKIAKIKKMDVIICPTKKGPFDTGFIENVDIGPQEWLGLIKNASIVFTDSYHGCIFSIIFNKQFCLLKRFDDNNKNSENSRIYTLTNDLNLKNRIFDSKTINNIDYINERIDYSNVNKLLNAKIEISKDWLLESVK